MILERVQQMLRNCATAERCCPPTVLFNENWMLRILLDWFSSKGNAQSVIPFLPKATWYSEALLASPFLSRQRGDNLAESYTHADGAIGHFRIGGRGRGDLVVQPDAKQLVIVEGKMFSRLSAGVSRARFYDQAARTIACIAQVLCLANRHPSEMATVAFFLVAPECQIKQGLFTHLMSESSVRQNVLRRVNEYGGIHDQWMRNWFDPLMLKVAIKTVSWEELLQHIGAIDPEFGAEALGFYRQCITYNQP